MNNYNNDDYNKQESKNHENGDVNQKSYFEYNKNAINNNVYEQKKKLEESLKEKYINSLVKDRSYSEKKENMILLLENEEYSRRVKIFYCFFTYNIIKHFLWQKGYFASFFYITRMSSVALSLVAIYLVRYEKELKIKKYGLNGYYNYYYKSNKIKEEKSLI